MAGRTPAQKAAFRKAIASGDRKEALEALRDRLAVELDEAPSAALAKSLAEVLRQLDSLGGEEQSEVDDLRAKRAARRKKAAAPKRAAKSVKRRAGGGRARS